jgi:hypothetical protein
VSRYLYRTATIEEIDPDTGASLIRLDDGTQLANPHWIGVTPNMFRQDDAIVVAIRDGRAFILGSTNE